MEPTHAKATRTKLSRARNLTTSESIEKMVRTMGPRLRVRRRETTTLIQSSPPIKPSMYFQFRGEWESSVVTSSEVEEDLCSMEWKGREI